MAHDYSHCIPDSTRISPGFPGHDGLICGPWGPHGVSLQGARGGAPQRGRAGTRRRRPGLLSGGRLGGALVFGTSMGEVHEENPCFFPGFFPGFPRFFSHKHNWSELTHLRFVGWTTKWGNPWGKLWKNEFFFLWNMVFGWTSMGKKLGKTGFPMWKLD